jgi:hypothetical protein
MMLYVANRKLKLYLGDLTSRLFYGKLICFFVFLTKSFDSQRHQSQLYCHASSSPRQFYSGSVSQRRWSLGGHVCSCYTACVGGLSLPMIRRFVA